MGSGRLKSLCCKRCGVHIETLHPDRPQISRVELCIRCHVALHYDEWARAFGMKTKAQIYADVVDRWLAENAPPGAKPDEMAAAL